MVRGDLGHVAGDDFRASRDDFVGCEEVIYPRQRSMAEPSPQRSPTSTPSGNHDAAGLSESPLLPFETNAT